MKNEKRSRQETDRIAPAILTTEVDVPQTEELVEIAQIAEALVLIDRGLGHMQHRELVSTDEVSDLLLDVRGLLTSPEVSVAELEEDVASVN